MGVDDSSTKLHPQTMLGNHTSEQKMSEYALTETYGWKVEQENLIV